MCAEDIAAGVTAGDVDATDDRVRLVSALLARMQAFADTPEPLIPAQSLDTAAALVAAIRAELPTLDATFQAGSSGLYFRIATEVRTWPLAGSIKLSGLTNQVTTLEEHLKSAAAAMESKADQVRAHADERLGEIDQRASQTASELEASFAITKAAVQSAAAESAQVTATVEQEKTRIDEAIRAHQVTFATGEGERALASKAQLDKVQQDWVEVRDEQEEQAQRHLAEMDEHERKSRKVLEAVGVNSTATDFGQYAKEQKRAANVWRDIAAAVFFTAGGVFAWITVEWPGSTGSMWEAGASRLGLITALAAVGAYGARESGQHRKEERRAKQVQLVLTALEPFLANLPEERQIEVRTEAARAIFVIHDVVAPEETSPQAASTTGAMLQTIRDLAAKLPDSTK